MKHIIFFPAVFLITSGISFSQAQESKIDITKKVLTYFQENKTDEIVKYFDDNMKAQLPSEKLSQVWQTLNVQAGKFKEASDIETQEVQGSEVVVYTCIFEKANLDLRLSFDPNNKINGMFFVPSKKKRINENKPVLIENDLFREESINVITGDFSLPGILTLPKGHGSFPIVVLVHGSGPGDMHASIGPSNPFQDIARGLASRGIASIRYDKRTKVYGINSAKNYNTITVLQETIEDAISAAEIAKRIKNADSKKVFIIGHSLGGMLAPRIAESHPELSGIIMMAGNARPLEDLIIEQFNYLFSLDGISEEEQRELDNMQVKVANVKSLNEKDSHNLPFNMPMSYWKDLKNYDPVETIQEIHNDILILQGERDYQVTMEDFAIWKKALNNRSNATFKSYAKLNHFFFEGTGPSVPMEYQTESHIPDYVIQDIADWIKEN
ncbi:alpha/beta fold hydrolase [Fulvivirgaceae bacterium BMA10]|uniref:Alpha/beta fold hydrolase n=1 Tax=Splendidivirga corallicola TaxID=3051826 RepID=A0ABT8KHB8_9BACT|nr:alpha/beta fold hydrolase [Fulvivirgaceae bacterium BMA10]